MSPLETVFADPARAAAFGGAGSSVMQTRIRNRRRVFGMLLVSYGIDSLVLLSFVHAGAIPLYLPPLFMLSGAAIVGVFWALSEIGFNDRFADHYLVVPQVAAQVALQYVFIFIAPQIGSAFLAVIFLIFCAGALRMTPRQATMALVLMALGAFPIFSRHAPLGMVMDTPAERMAAMLMFVSTIGQCVFVGLYGNSLRKKLYRSGVELRLAYSRIEELAELDELTGALNRRCIMRALDDEILRSQRSGQPCSIALIDLDWFKRINDLFGHPTGDEVLRTFAIAVFANIRAQDKFGRYGGEEFLLVLPDTGPEAAARMLDRLRLIVAEIDWGALSPGMNVTISAGVATAAEDDTADSFLGRADRSLYAAKRGGRNRVEARG